MKPDTEKDTKAEDLANLDYPFTISKIEGSYYVTFPDLNGCSTWGGSIEEVLAQIYEAKLSWIDACLNLGRAVPKPSIRTDYSGKFLVRCPKILHRQLSEQARKEGVSLNQYIVHALSSTVVLDSVITLLEEEFRTLAYDLKLHFDRFMIRGIVSPLDKKAAEGLPAELGKAA